MQRIFVSPFLVGAGVRDVFAGCSMLSTCASNVGVRDRHELRDFFAVSIFAHGEKELALIFRVETKAGTLDASP
jgi:hypothetical protein